MNVRIDPCGMSSPIRDQDIWFWHCYCGVTRLSIVWVKHIEVKRGRPLHCRRHFQMQFLKYLFGAWFRFHLRDLAFIQWMDWHRTGDNPLHASEQVLTNANDAIWCSWPRLNQHIEDRTKWSIFCRQQLWLNSNTVSGFHYSDVIMGTMASQIVGVSIVCWTVCSGCRCRSKKTSKPRVTGLCEGNQPVTSQGASNAENISIWWRHHELMVN